MPAGSGAVAYHLENADPLHQQITLDATAPGPVADHGQRGQRSGAATTSACSFWPGTVFEQAARASAAYAPLCGGRLLLRNPVPGHRSTLEATTEFLRDHVWRGEQVVGFVKREF